MKKALLYIIPIVGAILLTDYMNRESAKDGYIPKWWVMILCLLGTGYHIMALVYPFVLVMSYMEK